MGCFEAASLLDDTWPRYPFAKGRLRVEATLALPKPSSSNIDYVKMEFTRALQIARGAGHFKRFSDEIARGQIGMATTALDDYKGDGVLSEWYWKTLGDVMQGY